MRVALTGGATGIGQAVAEKLKAGGHTVDAFDISEPQSNIERWIHTDMNSFDSIRAAIESAQGPYDALINNAGVPPRQGQEETILRVNYFGLRTLLYGLLPKLNTGASIVNTASRAGAQWRENLDQVKALMALDEQSLPAFIAGYNIDSTRAYNLSKEALIVMTLADTQQMLEKGFRMNCVSPAAVSTAILDDFHKAFGDRVAKNVARVGRPGSPQEIADVIVFLVSPQSGWIKGQDILIDGGMSAMTMTDALVLNPTLAT